MSIVSRMRRLGRAGVMGTTAPLAPVARRVATMRFCPTVPLALDFTINPPRAPWAPFRREVPDDLKGTPGIARRAELERHAYESSRLRDFAAEYPSVMTWLEEDNWRIMVRIGPAYLRTLRRLTQRGPNTDVHEPDDPEALTREVKAHAARIGLNAIGVAPVDDKYTYVEFDRILHGDRVIVCIVEQRYQPTQEVPNLRSGRAVFAAEVESMRRSNKLVQYLAGRGYRARAFEPTGPGVLIHYGVQAGLGQLGLNGQLLTPQAGSRCRICLIVTNAPLKFDKPADFGIDKICDNCHACIRRCPGRALTPVRKVHRGVQKAKLNTARCVPVMAQANLCGICMKVCPVQKYGLERVIDHWEETGTILGKGTDELEGFDWPVDGHRYGPGERPKLEPGFFDGPDMDLIRDKHRTQAALAEKSITTRVE